MDIQSILPFILMLFVVYLFMIRPQMQRQKIEKKFNEALQKGDRIITKSGLHGKILEINDDGTVIVESGAGKLKYERSAISMEMSAKLNEVKK